MGSKPRLAALDRELYLAWRDGDQTLFVELDKERLQIERDNLKHSGGLAATPTGLMLLKKMIDDRLFVAAETFEKNQKRLGRAVCSPRETRSHLAVMMIEAAPAAYGELDPDDEVRVERQCRWVETEIRLRVRDWRMIEAVVVRGEMPAFLAYGAGAASIQLSTFRHDLEEIARFYDKPPAREDGRRGPRMARRHAPERA